MKHLLPLGLALLLSACANSKVVSSWKDDSLASVPFKKVLVVFQDSDEGRRRALEDEMARNIPNATPAYRALDKIDLRDVERAKTKVHELGFDSAVIMRVVNVEKETSYVPGATYVPPVNSNLMWGSWGYGMSMAYDPGYMRTDKIVTLGANVYSVVDEKLVWSSRSETYNPGSPTQAMQEVVTVHAKAVREAMGKAK
jgi:hypothetical protein